MSSTAPEQNFFRDVIYAAPQGTQIAQRAPWDIQRHQPALERVSSTFTGRVLDVGCGLGDNARWVATLPSVTQVLSIDLAPAAIAEAKNRGLGTAAPLTFEVKDLFAPDTIAPPSSFDTLLDSAVFHCIGDDKVSTAELPFSNLVLKFLDNPSLTNYNVSPLFFSLPSKGTEKVSRECDHPCAPWGKGCAPGV